MSGSRSAHLRTVSRRRSACAPLVLCALALLLTTLGCAQEKWVKLREVPANPLAGPLQLLSPKGPQATERTQLLVRRYNLEADLKRHDNDLLTKLVKIQSEDPSADKLYSLSELAYLSAKRAEPMSRKKALELHGLAVVNAYQYLFDNRFGRYRNPYDPEFRGACDLYNEALESAIRIIKKQGKLVPGSTQTINTANQVVETTIVLRGGNWRAEDFADFHFVSDYDLKGLQNRYHNYGLGVPLIAVRKDRATSGADEKFYPPGMSFPVTAFLRCMPQSNQTTGKHVVHLELYDPLNTSEISVDGRRVPLESDLTTPLAYALSQEELQDLDSSTAGLLNPAKAEKLQGLYMLEPYQPGKIPVLMIHGLWSSPITWMEMFNDLRGAPEIRDKYQFWFYLYPTGQPFWYSAARMRKDLIEARQILDPQRRQPALDHMVLVGHSMGGLVARLQTIDSGQQFWGTVSEKPFDVVQANYETKQNLQDTFFFQPAPAVQRVITLGTPYRGSEFSNPTTRWLSSKLITIPQMLTSGRQQLYSQNPGVFRKKNLLDVNTSIDSLAPDSPILPVMLQAKPAPWVRYHNIVGRRPQKGLLSKVTADGDGVVALTSAHLDDAVSEITVQSDHLEIHRHPLSVLEVRRVLLEHLTQIQMQKPSPLERLPYTASNGPQQSLPPVQTQMPVQAQMPVAPGMPMNAPSAAPPAAAPTATAPVYAPATQVQ